MESQLGYEDFTVWVDGEEVERWREEGIKPDPSRESDSGKEPEQTGEDTLRTSPNWQEDMFYPEWQVFDLHFEAGQQRTVRHTYRTPPHWFTSTPATSEFTYVLRTGANWAGTIGRAEVVVDFDGLRLADMLGASPSNFTVSESTIRWVFEDFEPHYDININYHDGGYNSWLRAGHLPSLPHPEDWDWDPLVVDAAEAFRTRTAGDDRKQIIGALRQAVAALEGQPERFLSEEEGARNQAIKLFRLWEAQCLEESGRKTEALAVYRDAVGGTTAAVRMIELGLDVGDWEAVRAGYIFLYVLSSDEVHAERDWLGSEARDVGGTYSIAARWACSVIPEDQHPDFSSVIKVLSNGSPTWREQSSSYTVSLPFCVKTDWHYRRAKLWYQVLHVDGTVTELMALDYPPQELRDLREISHGTFEIEVSKDNAPNETAPLQIEWWVEVETRSGIFYGMEPCTVVLEPGGAISGRVTDLRGSPLAGVLVGLQDQVPGGTIAQAKTDDSGFYQFSYLPSGDYYVWFMTEGYVPTWHGNVSSGNNSPAITVESASETTGIDMALAPEVTESEAATSTGPEITDDDPSPADDRWLVAALAVLAFVALASILLILNRQRAT